MVGSITPTPVQELSITPIPVKQDWDQQTSVNRQALTILTTSPTTTQSSEGRIISLRLAVGITTLALVICVGREILQLEIYMTLVRVFDSENATTG